MIPEKIIKLLESQLNGVNFGKVNLEISIHDGALKFRITKEISIVPDKTSSGGRG